MREGRVPSRPWYKQRGSLSRADELKVRINQPAG